MYGLYQIYCSANRMTYIGSSKNINTRMRVHQSRLRAGAHDNPKLQRAWDKYGPEAFTFTPLASALSMDMLLDLEQQALDILFAEGACFNIGRGALRVRMGCTLSPETRAKLREAKLGKRLTSAQRAERKLKLQDVPNPMQGRTHSAETLQKISEALLAGFAAGREPTRHPMSAEMKLRKAAQMRDTPPRKDKGKPLRGTCNGDTKEWLTTIACARDLGCDLSYPSQRVGTGKLVKGWLLEYI